MNENKLTQKSQEAIQAAQSIAIELGHQEIDSEHLLLALLRDSDGLVTRLLNKMDVPAEAIARELGNELGRRPSVSTSTEAGKIYVTAELQKTLVRAEKEAKRLKDEYVSVEHLLLALMAEGGNAGKILTGAGVDRDSFLAALRNVRGNQRVTSASPEAAYEALEKYGVDLVEQARRDKLDPVIGRVTPRFAAPMRILSRARPRTTRC